MGLITGVIEDVKTPCGYLMDGQYTPAPAKVKVYGEARGEATLQRRRESLIREIRREIPREMLEQKVVASLDLQACFSLPTLPKL